MKEIVLTRGYVALVDDEDYEFIMQWRWHFWTHNRPGRSQTYAQRNLARGKAVRMHNVIAERMGLIGLPDHINGNGLDNRRENLRSATPSQNSAGARWPVGRSGYRGVWQTPAGTWRAKVGLTYLGVFATAEESARIRDDAAFERWGEFAVLNFPRLVREAVEREEERQREAVPA